MSVTRSRALSIVSVALGATLLASCGGGGGGDEGSRTLMFAYVTSESSPHGQALSWWLDEVEARTGGEVTFERYWDATLLKPEEMVNGLGDGRVDIAQIQPTSYGANEFVATNVAEVPFISSNFPAVSAALATMVEAPDSAIRKEWNGKGIEPLSWQITAGGTLSTTEPVDGVDDLAGLRLRSIGRPAEVLAAAEASPIQLAAGDIYGSIDRGLIDGVFGVPFSFAESLKFPEVASHYTATGTGVSTANALAMSVDGWESLTEEQRMVMLEVSAEMPAKQAEIEPTFNDASCAAIQESGGTTSVFSDEEMAELADLAGGDIEAGWVADAEKAGVDGKALIAEYREAVGVAEEQFPDFELPEAACAAG
ncbi:TRAP transporter substrate-binding protein DctP [Nocardioides hwasunensis]|uniref:TRAP transporter substrate-binding protein DctP n=1 Tax=Nocardioides hwasunensis TaxID=397258 RepID=A0ABR8MM07_9ACTN|nr:TRAP transporter substrate-binding protein DctP [Nocardioides hwasunensis]MBD3917053.1 TRAP transporter substrate-binding protein DctP [Nocardioides hwasunensis]